MDALEGWDIVSAADVEWAPWGGSGGARAKLLGSADGYRVALVEAGAGYRGDPHEHAHAELFHLIDGQVRTQGRMMRAGDGYAAAAGSVHIDFVVEADARYVIVFRL